ncbi:MAG: transferase [Rhodospirillaceae bacterium]|jgi:sugar O-acyltransferase (sialic acid O-acetyltransferase NeuD family)|nr:transferase [Rhodospirillaceae bacterium]
MSNVIIFGTGVIADVVYHCLSRDSEHRVVAFTVDREFFTEDRLNGLPVIPFDELVEHYPPDSHSAMVAIGYHDLNNLRAERCRDMKEKGYRLINHAGGGGGEWEILLGENTFVMDHRSLQPGVSIGDNSFIWSGVTVGHHSSIGAHCWITSGTAIGGGVNMGDRCFVGLGVVVGHGVTMGEACFLGAGSRITKDAENEAVFITPDTEKFRLNASQFMRMTRLK